jgi:hypothetical protein
LGFGVLATGLVCPCHVLAGAAAFFLGAQPLSAAAQDGLHAVYVPAAVIVGAAVLRLRAVRPASSMAHSSPIDGGTSR